VTTGKPELVSGGAGGLDPSTTCGASTTSLESAFPEQLYAQTISGAYTATTEGATLDARGVALVQSFSVTQPCSSVSVPLRPYRPLPYPCWTATLLLRDATTGVVTHSAAVQVPGRGGGQWASLTLSPPAGPGNYTIELWPQRGSDAGRKQNLFESAAWVTNINSVPPPGGGRESRGGAGGGDGGGGGGGGGVGGVGVGGVGVGGGGVSGGATTLTFVTSDPPYEGGAPSPLSLGSRVAAAMAWQLTFATRGALGGLPGAVQLPQWNWRGVAADGVGAAGAFYDLIRSGALCLFCQ
jgi:hypothetical protein